MLFLPRGEHLHGRTRRCHGGRTLHSSPESTQRHPSVSEAHGGWNGLGAGERPFCGGSDTTGSAALAPKGGPGVRKKIEPGGAASVAKGDSQTARNMEATEVGNSPPPLTPPRVAPATFGATSYMCTGTAEGGGSTRGGRGRPRGPGRE